MARPRAHAVLLLLAPALACCATAPDPAPFATSLATGAPEVFTPAPMTEDHALTEASAGQILGRGASTASTGRQPYEQPSIGLPQKTSYGQSYYSPAEQH